jgi:hypothetical protein
MKLLILDDQEILIDPPDDPSHHDFTKDEICQVMDEEDFKHCLLTEDWDEVWLDHDLGPDDYCGIHTGWNGKKATLWIAEYTHYNGPLNVGLFRVTTMNIRRAPEMVDDLERAGYRVCRTPIFTIMYVKRGEFRWMPGTSRSTLTKGETLDDQEIL